MRFEELYEGLMGRNLHKRFRRDAVRRVSRGRASRERGTPAMDGTDADDLARETATTLNRMGRRMMDLVREEASKTGQGAMTRVADIKHIMFKVRPSNELISSIDVLVNSKDSLMSVIIEALPAGVSILVNDKLVYPSGNAKVIRDNELGLEIEGIPWKDFRKNEMIAAVMLGVAKAVVQGESEI